MALSDFWEIKDNQVLNGKAVLNVYHVKRLLAGANATKIKEAFLDTVVFPELRTLQDASVTRTTITVRNLGDVTDFGEFDSSTVPGNRAGEVLPGALAATIQFNRTRTDMKNGMKRFCVGTETDLSEAKWGTTFLTDLADLATAMLSNWEDDAAPGVAVCNFVVLKRFCIVPAQDPCLGYRLPDTSAEIDANHYIPLLATVRDQVRSQVSRKVL